MTTSVRAPSWHEDVRVCTLTFFVTYPLHKSRLPFSFSYLWLGHISVLRSYHLLSAEYVCVRLVHLFFFFFCLRTVFDSLSSCLHVGLDLFLVWTNLNNTPTPPSHQIKLENPSNLLFFFVFVFCIFGYLSHLSQPGVLITFEAWTNKAMTQPTNFIFIIIDLLLDTQDHIYFWGSKCKIIVIPML